MVLPLMSMDRLLSSMDMGDIVEDMASPFDVVGEDGYIYVQQGM